MSLLHLEVSQLVTNKRDSAVAPSKSRVAGQVVLSSFSTLSDVFVIFCHNIFYSFNLLGLEKI